MMFSSERENELLWNCPERKSREISSVPPEPKVNSSQGEAVEAAEAAEAVPEAAAGVRHLGYDLTIAAIACPSGSKQWGQI